MKAMKTTKIIFNEQIDFNKHIKPIPPKIKRKGKKSTLYLNAMLWTVRQRKIGINTNSNNNKKSLLLKKDEKIFFMKREPTPINEKNKTNG